MITRAIICILTYGLITLSCINCLAQDQLPFATGEWPPYTTERLQGKGMVTELVNAIVAEMGMKANVLFCPWNRAENMALQGHVFGVFPYAKTPERLENFNFSKGFIPTSSYMIFYNTKAFADKPKWNSLSDLKPYKIGAVAGSWYINELRAEGMIDELVANEEQIFRMLHSQRIDILFAEEHLGWWYVKTLFPGETSSFSTLKKPFRETSSPGGLMVSRCYPDSEKLLEQFNQAIIRIKENGVYQDIIRSYDNKPHN